MSAARRICAEHRQRIAHEIVLAQRQRSSVSVDPDVQERSVQLRAARLADLVRQYSEATALEQRLVVASLVTPEPR